MQCYLFTNNAGNKIAENKTLERLKRLFPAVGIDRSERRLHWHSFRRYFVKTCMQAGVPLNVLMRWTGHDTIAMALEYATANAEDAVRAIGGLESYLADLDAVPDAQPGGEDQPKAPDL